jgi:hypothetical protein
VKSRKKWEKKNGFGQEHRRGRLNRSSRVRRRKRIRKRRRRSGMRKKRRRSHKAGCCKLDRRTLRTDLSIGSPRRAIFGASGIDLWSDDGG